jgi:hypothetical protein
MRYIKSTDALSSLEEAGGFPSTHTRLRRKEEEAVDPTQLLHTPKRVVRLV